MSCLQSSCPSPRFWPVKQKHCTDPIHWKVSTRERGQRWSHWNCRSQANARKTVRELCASLMKSGLHRWKPKIKRSDSHSHVFWGNWKNTEPFLVVTESYNSVRFNMRCNGQLPYIFFADLLLIIIDSIIPATKKLSKNFDFLQKIFNVRFKSLANMKIGFIHLVQCLNPILTLHKKNL